MPAPKFISANEQEWIKHYLQETYNMTVVDAFDCQVLSEAIAKQTGTKISYSTLRRLFDLVANTNSQSKFVLNTLAVAVGLKTGRYSNFMWLILIPMLSIKTFKFISVNCLIVII